MILAKHSFLQLGKNVSIRSWNEEAGRWLSSWKKARCYQMTQVWFPASSLGGLQPDPPVTPAPEGTLSSSDVFRLLHSFISSFLLNVTQAGVIWEEKLQMRKGLHQTVCRQICRAFSWLMWVVPPLSRWSWIVEGSCWASPGSKSVSSFFHGLCSSSCI